MGRISIGGYEPAHLSHSTVNGFRSCPKKFELTKILRLEERPGLAALGGNAVHTATEQRDLEKFFGEVVDNGGVEVHTEPVNIDTQQGE